LPIRLRRVVAQFMEIQGGKKIGEREALAEIALPFSGGLYQHVAPKVERLGFQKWDGKRITGTIGDGHKPWLSLVYLSTTAAPPRSAEGVISAPAALNSKKSAQNGNWYSSIESPVTMRSPRPPAFSNRGVISGCMTTSATIARAGSASTANGSGSAALSPSEVALM